MCGFASSAGRLSHLFLVFRIFIMPWCVAGGIDVAVLVRIFCLRGRMVLVGRMTCEGCPPESSANFLPSPSMFCGFEWALYRCSLPS